jgi:hypothetical protein
MVSPNPKLTDEQIEASFSEIEKDNLELLVQAVISSPIKSNGTRHPHNPLPPEVARLPLNKPRPTD